MQITRLRRTWRGSSKIDELDTPKAGIFYDWVTRLEEPSTPMRHIKSFAQIQCPLIPSGVEYGHQAPGPKSLSSFGWLGTEKSSLGKIIDEETFMGPQSVPIATLKTKRSSTYWTHAPLRTKCGRRLTFDVKEDAECLKTSPTPYAIGSKTLTKVKFSTNYGE